jgi:nucleotide-binding universal stress UspA family protein
MENAVFKRILVPVDLRSQVTFGKRVAEIVRFARQNRSELIVMSSHKPDVENPAQSWDTISHRVAVLAPCSVLLVK